MIGRRSIKPVVSAACFPGRSWFPLYFAFACLLKGVQPLVNMVGFLLFPVWFIAFRVLYFFFLYVRKDGNGETDLNEFFLPSTLSSISFTCYFVSLPRSFSCNPLILYFALCPECRGYSTGGAHSRHEMRERE